MTSDEMIFEKGRRNGVTEIVTQLAAHQGMSIEQACKMCGYDNKKISWVLECIAADTARIAAEERTKELRMLSDYLLEPIINYSAPERCYGDPITTAEQQTAARLALLEVKKRITEVFDKLAMPRENADDYRPHVLQQHGFYGYRLLQFYVALRQKDFEWACRALRWEIKLSGQVYDMRTALAVMKILEVFL